MAVARQRDHRGAQFDSAIRLLRGVSPRVGGARTAHCSPARADPPLQSSRDRHARVWPAEIPYDSLDLPTNVCTHNFADQSSPSASCYRHHAIGALPSGCRSVEVPRRRSHLLTPQRSRSSCSLKAALLWHGGSPASHGGGNKMHSSSPWTLIPPIAANQLRFHTFGNQPMSSSPCDPPSTHIDSPRGNR